MMFLILIFLSVFAQAAQNFEDLEIRHAVPINLNYQESEELLKKEVPFTSKNEYVEKAIQAGQRTQAWLKHINSSLSQEEKWDFFSRKQQEESISKTDSTIDLMAYPMRYGPKQIEAYYRWIQEELPWEMASVIFENSEFKNFKEIDKESFVFFGQKLVYNYKEAVRWKWVSGDLPYYKAQRRRDIRGYYFLSKMKDVENQLKSWDNLSTEQKEDFSSHLKSICFNTRGVAPDCERELKEASNRGSVYAFYEKYIHKAKKVYDSFFELSRKRTDVLWTEPHTAFLPFQTIDNQRQRNFFIENVEDEWQWGDWKLKIQFRAKAKASIVFSPGVMTAVSNKGNRIDMDSNASLDSWGAQRVISHEIGHVLGFKDCYVEFYEEETGDMIYYVIDPDNIMCDQYTGKFSQVHYDKLKRHYFRPYLGY